jgi:hypothetical protein
MPAPASGSRPSSTAPARATVPSIENPGKSARALDLQLYQLFYEGKKPTVRPPLSERRAVTDGSFDASRKEAAVDLKLRRFLGQMSRSDRQLLLFLAQKIAAR